METRCDVDFEIKCIGQCCDNILKHYKSRLTHFKNIYDVGAVGTECYGNYVIMSSQLEIELGHLLSAKLPKIAELGEKLDKLREEVAEAITDHPDC